MILYRLYVMILPFLPRQRHPPRRIPSICSSLVCARAYVCMCVNCRRPYWTWWWHVCVFVYVHCRVAIGNTNRSRVPRCRFGVCFLFFRLYSLHSARERYYNNILIVPIISIIQIHGSFHTSTSIILLSYLFMFLLFFFYLEVVLFSRYV